MGERRGQKDSRRRRGGWSQREMREGGRRNKMERIGCEVDNVQEELKSTTILHDTLTVLENFNPRLFNNTDVSPFSSPFPLAPAPSYSPPPPPSLLLSLLILLCSPPPLPPPSSSSPGLLHLTSRLCKPPLALNFLSQSLDGSNPRSGHGRLRWIPARRLNVHMQKMGSEDEEDRDKERTRTRTRTMTRTRMRHRNAVINCMPPA